MTESPTFPSRESIISNDLDDQSRRTPEDIVVSWRVHEGFDAPTITFRGRTVHEVHDALAAAGTAGLYAAIAQAHDDYIAQWNLNKKLGAVPVNSPAAAKAEVQANRQSQPAANSGYQNRGNAAPRPSQGPPNATAPDCSHGQMEWKAGTSKAGNDYAFWACTSRNRADQCKPVYPK